MDLGKLNSNDPAVVHDYVLKKFKSFRGVTWSRKARIKKCDAYYLAAAAGPHGQDVIPSVYNQVFGELFDLEDVRQRAEELAAKKPPVIMLESGAWLERQEQHGDDVQAALAELNGWLEGNEWQCGERFFAQLVDRVSFLDDKLCDPTQFSSEFSSQCRAAITSETAMTRQEASAAFDLMVGFKQNARGSFESRSTNWGVVNAKLEESFRAGVWASGSAKANMDRLGFSAEVQAAVAVGALLTVEGELTWTKGDVGIKLAGSLEAFGGARAEASVALSVSAIRGIEASVSAGAFAGLQFKAEGSFALTFGNETLAKVTASASIDFGVGATFEASIKAPLFGPTTISIESGVTVGIGGTAGVEVEIHFDEIALASSRAFRQVVYWRTMARGYEMTLMNSDARNLYYLKKCIARLEEERVSTEGLIEGYNRTPIEKRKLLIAI